MNPSPQLIAQGADAATCQRCGGVLSSADAVCARCDKELAAEPPAAVISGKYNCPSCSGSFSQPLFTLVPAHAKWYVPQTQKYVCPHCKIRLVDSRNPPLSSYQIFALFVLATCAQFFVPAEYVQAARIAVVLLLVAMYLGRRSWGVPDRRRYVRDESQLGD